MNDYEQMKASPEWQHLREKDRRFRKRNKKAIIGYSLGLVCLLCAKFSLGYGSSAISFILFLLGAVILLGTSILRVILTIKDNRDGYGIFARWIGKR